MRRTRANTHSLTHKKKLCFCFCFCLFDLTSEEHEREKIKDMWSSCLWLPSRSPSAVLSIFLTFSVFHTQTTHTHTSSSSSFLLYILYLLRILSFFVCLCMHAHYEHTQMY